MIPGYIKQLIKKLEKSGFEAYIVGGCVRDLLLEKKPKDWDITTNAVPEKILKVFSEGKYENEFGTVLLPIKKSDGSTKTVVEITTYRSEQGYSDRRHPDKVRFENKLERDLSRRDFTVNAMAMKTADSKMEAPEELKNHINKMKDNYIVDLFGGKKDIQEKIIRAVGEPIDRFKEDALRMMRAIRFTCQLDFSLEPKTERAIKKMAGSIKFVSKERIGEELVKIFKSKKADKGVKLMHDNKLLQYIIPELEQGVGMKQNHHHIHTVFDHSYLSLKHCPSQDWRVKFAALIHDIGKPKSRKVVKGVTTFYNHEHIGAKIADKICKRLRFSNQDRDKIVALVKNHMFYYNVGEVSASSVRRLIKKVGEENLKDLIDLRIADRLGSGVPKAKPYKLRHLEYMMKKVRKDPISVKMLKINGDMLIKELGMKPGPKIGAVLDVLLSEVLDDPKLNAKKYLLKRAKELKEEELKSLREKAKDKIDEEKEKEDEEIKKQFWVK